MNEEQNAIDQASPVRDENEQPVIAAQKSPVEEHEEKIIYDVLPQIKLMVPFEECVEGMGRLIVQPIRIRKAALNGAIEIVPYTDKKVPKIPNNVKCFVVKKDKKIHNIHFQDEVIFADEFVPTSKEIDGIIYYVPHYNDVLLISKHIDPNKMIVNKRE